MAAPTRRQLADEVVALLRRRRDGATICPSEVARRHGEGWRELMPAVREAAAELAGDGVVVVTRGGQPVDAFSGGGPVRIGRGPRFPHPAG